MFCLIFQWISLHFASNYWFPFEKTMKTSRKLQNAVTVPKIPIKPNKKPIKLLKNPIKPIFQDLETCLALPSPASSAQPAWPIGAVSLASAASELKRSLPADNWDQALVGLGWAGWAGQSQSGLQILENWFYLVFQKFYWFFIWFYWYFWYSRSISRYFKCFALFSNGFPYMLLWNIGFPLKKQWKQLENYKMQWLY